MDNISRTCNYFIRNSFVVLRLVTDKNGEHLKLLSFENL
jgi:hypothetical protein